MLLLKLGVTKLVEQINLDNPCDVVARSLRPVYDDDQINRALTACLTRLPHQDPR